MSLSYLAIMEACLQERVVLTDDKDLYDLRYFYVDENHVGHCACGVAFEAMTRILRTRSVPFCAQEWYLAVQKSRNPVVRGFRPSEREVVDKVESP